MQDERNKALREKLEFDLAGYDDYEACNAKLEFILNRGLGFKDGRYNRIIVENLSDTSEGRLLTALIKIISYFKNLPLYGLESDKILLEKLGFEDESIEFYSKKTLKKQAKKKDSLVFSLWTIDSESNPPQTEIPIFAGFTKEEIITISDTLYKEEGE